MTAHRSYVFDTNLEAKDASLVASSAAATVDSAAKILDLGSGLFEATLVVDATAIEVDTGNEKYEIEWQLSSDSDFGTAGNVRCAAVLKLGDSSVNGSGADSAAGRYTLRVSNEFADTIYRYGRVYTRIAGTIATGINYSAYLAAV
jgi:hypothetical protein